MFARLPHWGRCFSGCGSVPSARVWKKQIPSFRFASSSSSDPKHPNPNPPPSPPTASADTATLKTYHLHGQTLPESKPGVRVETANKVHVIQTDLPKSMGGKDLAPQPVELLLASWMGCTQATALFVGRHLGTMTTATAPNRQRRRLLLDRLEFVDIRAVRDERGALELPLEDQAPPSVPSRLLEITGTIVVYLRNSSKKEEQGAKLSEEELEALREQTEWRCPVANMIMASGCKLRVQWVDGSTRLK